MYNNIRVYRRVTICVLWRARAKRWARCTRTLCKLYVCVGMGYKSRGRPQSRFFGKSVDPQTGDWRVNGPRTRRRVSKVVSARYHAHNLVAPCVAEILVRDLVTNHWTNRTTILFSLYRTDPLATSQYYNNICIPSYYLLRVVWLVLQQRRPENNHNNIYSTLTIGIPPPPVYGI
jgi:hypothetical protein